MDCKLEPCKFSTLNLCLAIRQCVLGSGRADAGSPSATEKVRVSDCH